MPKIGPSIIKPVIMMTIENILLIKIYLLFSKARNFDVYSIEIDGKLGRDLYRKIIDH